MNPKSRPRDPFSYRSRTMTFSAWAMAIVFATVATLSFAIDQTVTLAPSGGDQREIDPPSFLHPAELIASLLDAASK
jgi:hypothetical protein